MSDPTPGPDVVHPHPTVRAVMRERAALACAVFSGLAIFLGFAGKEIYPLAFVSLAPLLVALRGRTGWRAMRLGWVTGFVAVAGGFSWIVGMLKTFSGFPTPLCVLFASLLWIAQGLQYGLLAWLVSKADARNLPRLLAVPLLAAGVELVFPLLFPWYLSNSLHNAPVLFQTADIGGVLLVTAAMVLGHTALAEAYVRTGSWAVRLRPLALPLAFWALAVPYGYWRIGQVDADNAHARALRVGVVQQNLGLMQKRNDPVVALNRHLEASRLLESQGVEWIVWSESAVAFRIPETVTNIRDYIPTWDLRTPVLFGALSVRDGTPERPNLYNTAFMTDADGNMRGSYDKVFLLAFGEYIPLGETFPQIYAASPHSGHFTRGSTIRTLPVPGGTVAPLICYEDILPRFVRDFQNRVNPDLMAVILNDAWFGNTAEPWIHNALSKFRAVEHRRDLVRAANSGVSSIIDGAGRVVAESRTFTRENVVGTVHLRHGRTVYGYTGDWIGWAGALLAVYSVARRRQSDAAAA
jgi:apolipoprotein N-acyltransferase